MLESLRKTESDPGCSGVKEELFAWGDYSATRVPVERSGGTGGGRKGGVKVEAGSQAGKEETEAYSQGMLQGAASQPESAEPREGLRRRSAVPKEEKPEEAELARVGGRKEKGTDRGDGRQGEAGEEKRGQGAPSAAEEAGASGVDSVAGRFEPRNPPPDALVHGLLRPHPQPADHDVLLPDELYCTWMCPSWGLPGWWDGPASCWGPWCTMPGSSMFQCAESSGEHSPPVSSVGAIAAFDGDAKL